MNSGKEVSNMIREFCGNNARARIAIWGAGSFGRYVYDQLKNREDIEIRFFLDRNSDIVGKKIGEAEIFAPEHLRANYENIVDYVLVSFLGGIRIYDEFMKFGNIRFGVVKDRVFQNKLEFKIELTKDNNIFWVGNSNRPLLKSMETHVVDYCNLNCKGCSHFSNLYHKGDMIPFDIYCKDLKQLSENVNIFRFNMLGGEALLNDRIIDYINFTRKSLPYSDIALITNGLLLPTQKEEFFISCLHNNILIEVSEYLPTLRMKDQIISILERYGIIYRIRENISKFMKNIDLSGKVDKYKALESCLQGGCNLLREGKLYKCPFEALGDKFFEHFQLDMRFFERGGVDIYEPGLDWKELIYNYEKNPVDACRYCGKGEWFPWESSHNPTVNDWIVRN